MFYIIKYKKSLSFICTKKPIVYNTAYLAITKNILLLLFGWLLMLQLCSWALLLKPGLCCNWAGHASKMKTNRYLEWFCSVNHAIIARMWV